MKISYVFNKKFLLFILVISIIGAIVSVIYGKYHADYLSDKPIRYCYYYGKNNSLRGGLYIKDLSHKADYITYYDYALDGVDTTFKFPLKGVSFKNEMYILDTLEDNSLIKIGFYDSSSGNYEEGWVLPELLHESPPDKK